MSAAKKHERRLRAVAERDGWADVWGSLEGLVARLGRSSTRPTEELFMAIVDAMEAAHDAGHPRESLCFLLVRTQSALIMAMRNPAKVGDVVQAAHAFASYKPHVCAWGGLVDNDTKPWEPYGSAPATAAERKTRILAEALSASGDEICVRKLRSGRYRVRVWVGDWEVYGRGDTPELAWEDAFVEVRIAAEDRVERLRDCVTDHNDIAAALARVAK
jgi:hypothetical protein